LKVKSENNKINLYNTENLKKYQISQMNFYGYKQRENYLEKYTDNIEIELLKVIQYLDEESISYELLGESSELIDRHFQRKDAFTVVFSKANKIKGLDFLDDEFIEFKKFTEKLPRKLKPHQTKSAFHFYTLKNGANFSVPGSGKTTTILSVYEKLRLEGKCNLLFIVGPPSCFQPWKNEFHETLGRRPRSLILSGTDKSFRKSEYYRSEDDACELYLSTFHTALNDYHHIIKFLSQIGINAFFIVDEAHYIKQLGGVWASSIIKIGKHAAFKGVLTGTPMPKGYKDLFNLFDFLWEDLCPLTEDDKIMIEHWEKKNKNYEIKELLNLRIGALFYRVSKKDLGLIPPVFHEPIIVEMNKIEKSIYDAIKAKIFELDQSYYFKNEDILHKLWKGRIMRLRQAASYPKLLLSSVENYDENLIEDPDLQQKIKYYDQLEIPSKLEALQDLVMKLRREGKKILIWSNFIGTLQLIRSHFNSLGEDVGLIYGKTPIRNNDTILISEEKTREDIRDEFLDLDSGLDILVANPAACAESISLHKTCFNAIYYDLSYNAAQYLQSLDRIHRVGGSEINEAHYYFLQFKNSIDQDIKENIEAKAQKMYEIIEQDYNVYNMDMYADDDENEIEAYKRLLAKS
jgi:SNF2 family DNA or RNA helicase